MPTFRPTTRRRFLQGTAAAGTAALLGTVTSRAHGYQSANERPVFATIGLRNQGWAITSKSFKFADFAALADVDANVLGANVEKTEKAQGKKPDAYSDYRKILDRKDIDAVMIATPDHMHAPIASAAMSLGKHVYVEKPLCWSAHEARHLARRAVEMKVVTQMGNQGHSGDGARRGQDYLTSGVLGDIREVHVWTNRPFAFWPQGVPRPSAASGTANWNSAGLNARLANAMASGNYPVPDSLSWDLFLGVAPFVE
jgi:predicted dehydrogenase